MSVPVTGTAVLHSGCGFLLQVWVGVPWPGLGDLEEQGLPA